MSKKEDASPNYPEELTESQKRKMERWLIDKWGSTGECPICRHSDWIVSNNLVTPNMFSTKGTWLGGPHVPMALLICRNCGHTLHFNAIVAGLIAPEPGEGGAVEDDDD